MIVKSSNREWRAWVGMLPIFAFLIIAFDPSSSVVARTSGTVVSEYPMGRFSNGRVLLRVVLPSGALVIASAPADNHYPYAPGSPVIVTTFATLLTHRKHYEALAGVTSNAR